MLLNTQKAGKLIMHNFQTALDYIDNVIYKPNRLTIKSIYEEKHNSDYAADKFELGFELNNIWKIKTIRFRVAKITPTKIGQFVTCWEKGANNINQPYHFDEAPDLLVITIFSDNNIFGQFVFSKDILLKKNILTSDLMKGKMAIRIYPS